MQVLAFSHKTYHSYLTCKLSPSSVPQSPVQTVIRVGDWYGRVWYVVGLGRGWWGWEQSPVAWSELFTDSALVWHCKASLFTQNLFFKKSTSWYSLFVDKEKNILDENLPSTPMSSIWILNRQASSYHSWWLRQTFDRPIVGYSQGDFERGSELGLKPRPCSFNVNALTRLPQR